MIPVPLHPTHLIEYLVKYIIHALINIELVAEFFSLVFHDHSLLFTGDFIDQLQLFRQLLPFSRQCELAPTSSLAHIAIKLNESLGPEFFLHESAALGTKVLLFYGD